MWNKIKNFFAQVWGFLKKIPAKTMLFLLLIGALIYWLVRKYYFRTKQLEIIKERDFEKKRHDEVVDKIEEEGEEEIKNIEAEYIEKLEELDEREKEINKALSEGPVALANKWKEYLNR